HGILSLDAAAKATTTAPQSKKGAAGVAAIAGGIGSVRQMQIPGDQFGLGISTISAQVPGDAVRVGIASAAPEHGSLPAPTIEAAATSFLAFLFRRGRVDLGDNGDKATRVEHRHVHKTHELERTGDTLKLVRRCFDCGFD